MLTGWILLDCIEGVVKKRSPLWILRDTRPGIMSQFVQGYFSHFIGIQILILIFVFQVIEAGDMCAICQEKMQAPVLLRCKHIFCEDCVSEWLD